MSNPLPDISTEKANKNAVVSLIKQLDTVEEIEQNSQIQLTPMTDRTMMPLPSPPQTILQIAPPPQQMVPQPIAQLAPQTPPQMDANNFGLKVDYSGLIRQILAYTAANQQQPIQETPKSSGQRGPYKPKAIQMPDETYQAVKVPALCGVHPALLYRCKENVYSFMFKRQNKNGVAIYVCSPCKRQFNKEIKIKVKDDQFLEDPTKIPHQCQPQKWSTEIAKRKIYATTQKLKTESVHTTPKEAFEKMKAEILNDPNINSEEKNEVCADIGNLKRHRRAFSRAINVIRPKQKKDEELNPESDPQGEKDKNKEAESAPKGKKEAQSSESDLPSEIASAPATPANHHHNCEEDAPSGPHTI